MRTTFYAVLAMAAAFVAVPLGAAIVATPELPATVTLSGNVSPLLADSVVLGAAPLDMPIEVVMALKLRNSAELDQFLADVQDPASPVFHQFLTQDEFNARFAPTADQEAAVEAFLVGHGFTITQTFANRLLVAGQAPVGLVQETFGVHVASVLYNDQVKYASLEEPTVPSTLAPLLVGVLGLDNIGDRHSMVAGVQPHDNLGSNCCYFSPRDLNVAYNEDHNGAHTGAGSGFTIAGAYDIKDSDFSAFNTQMGLPSATINRVCTGSSSSRGCAYNSQNSVEVSLDVEYAHGTAPQAQIWSYMAASTSFTDFTTMENRVVSDHKNNAVSESWGACENAIAASTISAEDQAFQNANAVGQTWFFASGDNGNKDCSGSIGVDYPAASSWTTGVGGTHLTCSSGMTASQPVCGGWGSETAWSGSGGGFSTKHSKPSWQTGCGVPADGHRDVPDIALEADTSPGNLVAKGGGWYAVGGTSDAAPQLAGMFAVLNGLKGPQGNANVRFYQLCGTSVYHDVTSGSNGYSAGVGYDEVTGLGTINEGNLLASW